MTEQEREIARIAKRAYYRDYMRRWRAENPEKARKARLRYWVRRAQREAGQKEVSQNERTDP